MHKQEVVSIHVGQAGIQLGNAFWELLCAEHGIKATGRIPEEKTPEADVVTFFHETPAGQFVPRALLMDLEPTVLDEIRTGSYNQLFHPDLMINGKDDAGNNFARGYYTLGKCFISKMIENTRMIAEACDFPQGFMVFNSYGGGTGSGLTSLFIDRLKVEFGRKPCINIAIYPGQRLCTSTVEPYNAILTTDRTLDTNDVALVLDNESLYNISSKLIGNYYPTFVNINRLIAPMISGLTSSLRYGGTINCSLTEIQTNLIPFPRIHFPMMSYAPLTGPHVSHFQVLDGPELTRSLFEKDNQTVNCNLEQGKFMASCLIYKGNTFPTDVYKILQDIKRNKGFQWVDWCPTGFKIGVTCMPPTHLGDLKYVKTDNSILMLANHTGVAQPLKGLESKFDKLYSKRSFVHWFVGEGMEEDELVEARCTVSHLVRDFYTLGEHDEKDERNPEPITYNQDDYRNRHKQRDANPEQRPSTETDPFPLSGPENKEYNGSGKTSGDTDESYNAKRRELDDGGSSHPEYEVELGDDAEEDTDSQTDEDAKTAKNDSNHNNESNSKNLNNTLNRLGHRRPIVYFSQKVN